jgi:hypothetical protein
VYLCTVHARFYLLRIYTITNAFYSVIYSFLFTAKKCIVQVVWGFFVCCAMCFLGTHPDFLSFALFSALCRPPHSTTAAAANAAAAAEDPRDLHAYVLEDQQTGFRCQLCGRAGASRRDVRNHVESVHFPHMFTYECAVCGIKLSSRKSLDNHKYRHHRPMAKD